MARDSSLLWAVTGHWQPSVGQLCPRSSLREAGSTGWYQLHYHPSFFAEQAELCAACSHPVLALGCLAGEMWSSVLSCTLSTLALSPSSLLQAPPNPHPQRSFLPITHAPAAGLDRSVIVVSAVVKCLSGKDPCQCDRGSWDPKGWLSGNGVGLWDAERSGGE